MAIKKKATPAIKLDTLSEVNDLGKPWRFVDEDTGLTVTRTCMWSPPGCHPIGCGVKLYTDENDKLVKVEGDENHPVTQGRLCPRCIALKDYIYNPSRITHPMKRDPKYRGEADKWERIAWDEALDIIEKNYRRITEEYGLESVVAFAGTGREGGVIASYFASLALGTPNLCYTQSGYACFIPRMAAGTYISGIIYPELDYAGALPGRYDDPLYEIPEYIILWGKEPLKSNPDGMFGHAVIDLMKRGTRIIVIDPRVNWISTRAAYHLQIRAGTDTALGLAMIDVIAKEKLYDQEFVEYWCYGFEELEKRAAEMPPEKAAEICGIDAEEIIAVARAYAKAKSASILWGLAVDQKTNGMQHGQVIMDLMSITGNIDRPGGQLVASSATAISGDENTDDEMIPFGGVDDPELRKKTIGLADYPGYCGLVMNSQADMTLHALETEEPYPLRMGMYVGNNLLACTSAEPQRWYEAINKSIEFCVAFDCFMTPSAQATCDVFLPLATIGERESTIAAQYGQVPLYRGWQNKALDPGECKGDIELLYLLGKRLNPDKFADFANDDELLRFLHFNKKTGNEHLREEVCVQYEHSYYKYQRGEMRTDGKLGFNTPSGRIELYSNAFRSFGEDPLPYYEEPHFSPISTPELMEQYPFVLTTGARTYAFFHSEHRQIPLLRELNPNPIVEVNPAVAAQLGIAEGQWCKIWNQFGECVMKAKLTQEVDEKTIHTQHGWWFPEEDGNAPNLYGTFRSNVNNLVPNFHFGKMGFGAPFKSMICNIKPLEQSYDTNMQEVAEKFGLEV